MTDLDILCAWIQESERTVFFGGAGVSVESGIPDFRSENGLYRMKYSQTPEEILSHSYYEKQTEQFFDFYREFMLYPDAEPNPAHTFLAKLEQAGKLSAVITQNIDGLHQKAGSRHVLELHGSVYRNYCERCKTQYKLEIIRNYPGVPHCPECGGRIKPDVVLYGEALPEKVMRSAVEEIRQADLLLIGGTSLNVYPAAGYLDCFQGKHIVLLNMSQTAGDARADMVIREPIGAFLEQASRKLKL